MRPAHYLLIFVSCWLVLELAKDRFDGKPSVELVQATATMVAELESRGMVVETAQEVSARDLHIMDLLDDTTRMGKAIGYLQEQLRERGGQLVAVTELSAQLTAELAGRGVSYTSDTLLVPMALPDSVLFAVDDPGHAFTGQVSIFPRLSPWQMAATMNVLVRAGVTITNAPDGRVLIGAIAADPRVSLAIENAYWSPPPAVARCTLRQRAQTAAWTVALSEGIRLGVALAR